MRLKGRRREEGEEGERRERRERGGKLKGEKVRIK